MVEQILSLSLRRNIPVANFTVTVGFETTPQRMEQMKVRSRGLRLTKGLFMQGPLLAVALGGGCL